MGFKQEILASNRFDTSSDQVVVLQKKKIDPFATNQNYKFEQRITALYMQIHFSGNLQTIHPTYEVVCFFSFKMSLPCAVCFPANFVWLLLQKFNILLVHGNRLCSRESRAKKRNMFINVLQ